MHAYTKGVALLNKQKALYFKTHTHTSGWIYWRTLIHLGEKRKTKLRNENVYIGTTVSCANIKRICQANKTKRKTYKSESTWWKLLNFPYKYISNTLSRKSVKIDEGKLESWEKEWVLSVTRDYSEDAF